MRWPSHLCFGRPLNGRRCGCQIGTLPGPAREICFGAWCRNDVTFRVHRFFSATPVTQGAAFPHSTIAVRHIVTMTGNPPLDFNFITSKLSYKLSLQSFVRIRSSTDASVWSNPVIGLLPCGMPQPRDSPLRHAALAVCAPLSPVPVPVWGSPAPGAVLPAKLALPTRGVSRLLTSVRHSSYVTQSSVGRLCALLSHSALPCRFSSPPAGLIACSQRPTPASAAPGAALSAVLGATSVPRLCSRMTNRVPSTASAVTASPVPVLRCLSQLRAAPLPARTDPPPMSPRHAGSTPFSCISLLKLMPDRKLDLALIKP